MPEKDRFAPIPNWFYEEGFAAVIGSHGVNVYACLRLHENRTTGLSYPGLGRIMEQTGLSKPTVILALKALNDCEVITEDRESVIPGKHAQTAVYRFQKPDKPVSRIYRSSAFTGLHDLNSNRSSAFTGKCGLPVKASEKPVNAADPPYIIEPEEEPKKSQRLCVTTCPDFDRFWKAYPRNENRKKALEWWQRHQPSPEEVAAIAAGLKRSKASSQWKRGVIPHAITWLNQERWTDEPFEAQSNGSGKPRQSNAEYLDELLEKGLIHE